MPIERLPEAKCLHVRAVRAGLAKQIHGFLSRGVVRLQIFMSGIFPRCIDQEFFFANLNQLRVRTVERFDKLSRSSPRPTRRICRIFTVCFYTGAKRVEFLEKVDFFFFLKMTRSALIQQMSKLW